MTPDDNNIGSNRPSGKDENDQSSSIGRKTSNLRPQEPALKCPRCDSPNTKFCYYNNYSLTQPRHFCKTCRRYWTKGGALRNVPIGGGCRKNKKMKACTRISGDSKDSSGSSDIVGLKFFQGISPAMDFQLGGINFSSPSTCLFNQFSSFGDLSNTCNAISSSPCFNLDPVINPSPLMGLSFPFCSTLKQVDVSATSGFQEMRSLNVQGSIASSIESLSSINQDLHWKLQQQRLANMLYVGDHNHKENSSTSLASATIGQSLVQKPQPILFQNLDTSRTESCGIGTSRKDGTENGNLSTEWFFDNSYATVTPTPATSSSPNNANANANNTNNWSGMQAWSDLTQYTVLP